MSRRAWVAAGGVVVLALIAALLVLWPPANAGDMLTGGSGAPLDTAAMAPTGARIRVRVLNGAGVDGLARRGTQTLRDFGYDVVEYRNAAGEVAGTLIEVNPSHQDVAERLRRALGTGTIQVNEPPLAYLDVSVTLGPDWKPSPQSFRP